MASSNGLDRDSEHLAENEADDGNALVALTTSLRNPPAATDGAACISYSLQAFDEKDSEWIFARLNNLPTDSLTEYSIEDSEERTKVVLDRYQEQPHLLDTCLPRMFSLLTKYFTVSSVKQSPDALANDPLLRKQVVLASKYMVLLAKVRGYKVIIRYLPHEVSDLPRVLYLLQQPALVERNWEVCYMLLLWLSIAAQVPFKLALLDAAYDSAGARQNTLDLQTSAVQQMFDISERYLVRPQCDKRQDAAAFLLAKLLARPDTQPIYLKPTIDWLLARISDTTTTAVQEDKSAAVGNALLALSMIFKYCARDALLPHAPLILERLVVANLLDTTVADESGSNAPTSALETVAGEGNVAGGDRTHRARVRYLYMKAIHRVGLSLLRTRSHVWKYQKHRVLLGNVKKNQNNIDDRINGLPVGDSADVLGISNVQLSSNKSGLSAKSLDDVVLNFQNDAGKAGNDDAVFDVESVAVDPNIEVVLGELLRGLRDRDTIVRWPAAKGIGRIADRLPPPSSAAAADGSPSYCADIIDSILEIFQTYDADGTWHGACLALAEMARRGCVGPAALSSILPNVERALLYDCPRGSYSVGQQVRDAACYVYWAFARAFSPEDMMLSSSVPIIPRLRVSLLIVALFDREVNCRRAAAAAIQESIGRQGVALWPHGIELIQLVDFEGVGRRSNTYLRLAPQICALMSSSAPSAQQPSMAQLFIEHLITYKAVHTERTIRDLASKSVALLAPYCQKSDDVEQRKKGAQFLLQLLNDLLGRCISTSLTGATHGLLLCAGNLFFSVCQCLISNTTTATGDDKEFGPKFSKSAQWRQISHAAVNLVMLRIPESRILHGVGQEMLREAVLHYTASLMKAQLLAPVEVLCVAGGDSSSCSLPEVANNYAANGSGERVCETSRTKLMQTLWLAIRECLENRSERVQFLATKCLRDYCMLLLYDHERTAATAVSIVDGRKNFFAEGDSLTTPTANGSPSRPMKFDLRSVIRNSSSFDDILSAAAIHASPMVKQSNGFCSEVSPHIDRAAPLHCLPQAMQIVVDYCFSGITGTTATNSPQTATAAAAANGAGAPTALNITAVVKKFVPPSEARRRGGIGALTALPTPITLLPYYNNASLNELDNNRIILTHAVDICIESTRQDVWFDCRWLECRAAACSTLTELLLNAMTLFEDHETGDDVLVDQNNRKLLIRELSYVVARVFEFLASNLNDYTREASRGDIGRMVRERALECLDRLLGKLAHFGSFYRLNLLLSRDDAESVVPLKVSIQRIVAVAVRLACENVDRTRTKAISLLLTVCGFLNSHTKNLSVTDADFDEDDDEDNGPELNENDVYKDGNVENNSGLNRRNNNFYADFVADFDTIADAILGLIAEAVAADAIASAGVEQKEQNTASLRADMIAAGTLFSVAQIFHAMCRLLSSPHYAQFVIDGLTLSIGSLTRSLVTDGVACLEAWFVQQQKAANTENLSRFMQCLETLAGYAAKSSNADASTTKQRIDAYDAMIPMPILRVFSTLLEYGLLTKVVKQSKGDAKYLLSIFEHLRAAAATNRAMHRVLLWISICSGFLQFDFDDDDDDNLESENGENADNVQAIKIIDDLRQRALKRLLILLAHAYPRIRFQAALQLQETLLLEPELLRRLIVGKSNEEEVEGVETQIMLLLDETDWNAPDREKSVRVRDELSKLFGIKSLATGTVKNKA